MSKNNPGGAADFRRRGMKAVVIPLAPADHELVKSAAQAEGEPVSRCAAVALVRWARNRLKAARKLSEDS